MQLINLFYNKNSSNTFSHLIANITGFKPKNIAIYRQAFTHSSLRKVDKHGNDLNYERLEFLGDAILSSVVSCFLFEQIPDQNEGYLTKMRSKIVSRQNLNQLGKDFDLASLLDSDIHQNNHGQNIYGNLFESLIGAIYLDKGYKICEHFIYDKIIDPYVDIDKFEKKVISYKGLIIEWCQKQKIDYSFDIDEEVGVDKENYFIARFYLNEKIISKAREISKKVAVEKASRRAFYALQDQIDD
ncbi:MAG: ribonuclease III [Psychroflexus sp.]|jgi:ribonuclease-3|nr:ribonuclease III [Psychroflexus sp.]MDR9447914.1 ribonuclease III [Psychroflexus sp.]